MNSSAPSLPHPHAGDGPLRGLRVIELSSFVAAPLAGMTLQQLGAEVIRVDPLGGAADIGRWPLAESGTSLFWAGLNKGKRSLEVDLRQDAGRQLVLDLLATSAPKSAVVLTNITGWDWLSYESLTEVCPDVIRVEIRGNHDGSPAVDYTVNANTGFPLVTGSPDVGPVNHVLPAWDISCGLYAAMGVSAAARKREVTGQGESIRIALADVALATAGNLGYLAEAEVSQIARPKVGNHLYGSFARDFACADGTRTMVVALTPRHWRDLVDLTGVRVPVDALQSALGVDFSVEGDRYRYREALASLMEQWFASHSAESVANKLSKTSVIWSPYRTFIDIVADLDSAESHPLMTKIEQPGVGSYWAPSLPLDFGSSHPAAAPAPALGHDTAEILRDDLGLTREAILDLTNAKVISPTRVES